MSSLIQSGAMQGKVALVTGGGSGIGAASSRAFAALGARVVIADITLDGAKTTVEMIQSAGGEASFIRADVSRSADVAALMSATVERYGRLDYAHNNAGIYGSRVSLLDYPEDVWDKVIAVNLTGIWLCMKHEIPQMLAQGGGAIVNTASGAGLTGSPNPAYGASKHGVVGITRSAAREFAGRGVRVNAICPAVIDTPMAAREFSPEVMASIAARNPMGRVGTAEEVAQVVVWLCSDAASYVNGVAMPVDGSLLA